MEYKCEKCFKKVKEVHLMDGKWICVKCKYGKRITKKLNEFRDPRDAGKVMGRQDS